MNSMIHIHDLESVQPDAMVFGTKGIIETVYPPNDQTEGQRKHGIHNQAVLVRDMEGNAKFMVKLIAPEHHIDKTAEGRVITLVSGKDNNDRIVGLQMKEWKDKKYLEAGKSAQVKVDQAGQGQTGQAARPAPQQPAQRAATPSLPVSTLTLDDLAKQHRNCFDAVKNAYAGSGLPIENLTAIATTMFIEGNRSGLFKRNDAPAPVSSVREQPTKEPAPKVKIPVKGMTTAQVRDALHLAYRARAEGAKSQRVDDLIDEAVLRVIPWVDAIKPYKDAFVAKHSIEEWKKRVADLKTSLRLKPDDHEGLAKIIVTDQLTFEA